MKIYLSPTTTTSCGACAPIIGQHEQNSSIFRNRSPSGADFPSKDSTRCRVCNDCTLLRYCSDYTPSGAMLRSEDNATRGGAVGVHLTLVWHSGEYTPSGAAIQSKDQHKEYALCAMLWRWCGTPLWRWWRFVCLFVCSLVRILGEECSTIHSPPALYLFYFF